MPFQDVRQFMAKLSSAGELLEIDAEVDPNEELGAICRKVLDENGPAILFNNVIGYNHPVFANMLGKRKRIAMAMETAEENLVDAYLEGRKRTTSEPLPIVPRGPVKDVVIPKADLRLTDLVPGIISNPGDGGAYINYALIIMRDPDSGRRNMGIYRLQLREGLVTGIWSSPTSHAGTIRAKFELLNKPTEVAVCIGGDPLLYIASQIPGLELGVDEMEVAAAMRGMPYPLVKCDTVDLEVPADCEMVLEGCIQPNVRREEGPYGEYHGYYCRVLDQPIIEFQHATRRKDPIWIYTYLGVPPTDTHALGQVMGEAGYTEKLRKDVAPTVRKVYCPLDMHTIVVSLKKTYEEQAKHVIYALWSTRGGKTVIVVDEDIDPSDSEAVYWAIAVRSHPTRDVLVSDGFGTIGPATHKYADQQGRSSKLGIDATEPLTGFPRLVRPRPEMVDRVKKRWAELTASKTRRLRTGT